MIGLIQRVTAAEVRVAHRVVGSIDRGLLVLVGVTDSDTEANEARLARRLLGYRVFPDAAGRMNRNVQEVGGGLLLVPQFTLAADTRNGLRPSFTPAAPPDAGAQRFAGLVAAVQGADVPVATGLFGADMAVSLVNDGPVTFWLEG